jgi:RNA polymerase sigma factor (sigma-70 family)
MKSKTFEECLDAINCEITKRRHKWNLTAIAWMDYDDVAQILRIHIHKKWALYDQTQPLGPWVNRVISRQIKNLIRNVYSNFSRPCLRCAAAEGESGCRIYAKQCADCPLYATWEKTKKRAHNCKLPVSLENHSQEVFDMTDDNVDITRAASQLHEKMLKSLKPIEARLYDLLYIQNKTEEEVAKIMNYRTSEKGRAAGYKNIANVRKAIITKAKKLIAQGEVDI